MYHLLLDDVADHPNNNHSRFKFRHQRSSQELYFYSTIISATVKSWKQPVRHG